MAPPLFPGQDHSNSEAVGTLEVFSMKSKQKVGTAFHGQFQNEFVLWVRQKRPPKKEDGAQIGLSTKES